MTIIGKLQNKPKAAIDLWGRIKGHTVGNKKGKSRRKDLQVWKRRALVFSESPQSSDSKILEIVMKFWN